MKRLPLWIPLAWLLAFVATPTLIIAAHSFYERGAGRPIPAFSTEAWRSILTADTVVLFGRSGWIGLLSTLSCLAIGYPVAWFIAGCTPRWKRLLLALVVLPFWTNTLSRTTAMKLIFVWAAGDEFHSTPAVVIGLVYGYLPFMILPLFVAIEKVPRRLLEAAADLGAGPTRRFWTVTIPLTAPGIAAGCILVFIPCFGAFVTPAILGSVESEPLGPYLAVLMRGNVPAASGLSILMMAAVLALLAVYYRTKRDGGIV